MRIELGDSDDPAVIRKRAESLPERRRLAREAAILRRAAHPGVVELVSSEGGDPPEALLLRRLDGGDLVARGASSLELAAGVGATLATTVADLHDIGVAHGDLATHHVLFDAVGRPVLCGFGKAVVFHPQERGAPPAVDDDAALCRLLLQILPQCADRRLRRLLLRGCTPRSRGRHVAARRSARELVIAVPNARLVATPAAAGEPVHQPGCRVGRPGAPRRTGGVWRPRALPVRAVDWIRQSCAARRRAGPRAVDDRSRRRCVVAVSTVAASATAVLLATLPAWTGGRGGTRLPTRAAGAAGCPTVDLGCLAEPARGLLHAADATYRLLQSDSDYLELRGRWTCGGQALPAVVDAASGSVWVFDAWPSGGAEAGRLLLAVGPLRRAQVRPGPHDCDDIAVLTRAGSHLVIDPRARPAAGTGLR